MSAAITHEGEDYATLTVMNEDFEISIALATALLLDQVVEDQRREDS